MQEAGAGDVDACSMLLVDRRSCENQDVQKFVKEGCFVKVGETGDSRYDILQRAMGADTEEVEEEEEEEGTEVSIETIIDFEEILDEDDAELLCGEHRGRTGGDPQPKTKCYIKAASWSSEDVQELRDVGVKSLHLDLELLAEKNVDVSESSVWKDGLKIEENAQGCFTEIQLALSSVIVDLQAEPSTKESTSKHVVYRIEIKFFPTELWAGDEQCIFVKVEPKEAKEVTLTTAKEVTGSVMLSKTPGVQVGGKVSNTVAEVVKQHEWRSESYLRTRAAAWVWSIGYWRDGRRFNPSKTNLRQKISAELINRVLAPDLAAESSLQLTATGVSATWTVNARDCHLQSFDFVVEVTLHTTVFRFVDFFEGCRGWLGGSKRDPVKKFSHKGRLSIGA